MLSAISRTITVSSGPGPRRSPSMDAQLSTARAKLEDWVTCPSAKTPEGKEEIVKASAKLQSIKAAIKKADESSLKTSNTDVRDTTPAADTGYRNQINSPREAPDNVVQELARLNRAASPVFGYAPILGKNLNDQA